MAIKSSAFSAVELSSKDAERFLKHLQQDRPNQTAQATLARGKDMLRAMTSHATSRVTTVTKPK